MLEHVISDKRIRIQNKSIQTCVSTLLIQLQLKQQNLTISNKDFNKLKMNVCVAAGEKKHSVLISVYSSGDFVSMYVLKSQSVIGLSWQVLSISENKRYLKYFVSYKRCLNM